MTRKIKLTRANKSILLKALAPYYYQEKALGHNTENPGRLILKIDSVPADKKFLAIWSMECYTTKLWLRQKDSYI